VKGEDTGERDLEMWKLVLFNAFVKHMKSTMPRAIERDPGTELEFSRGELRQNAVSIQSVLNELHLYQGCGS
jgi:hypothetical protein